MQKHFLCMNVYVEVNVDSLSDFYTISELSWSVNINVMQYVSLTGSKVFQPQACPASCSQSQSPDRQCGSIAVHKHKKTIS